LWIVTTFNAARIVKEHKTGLLDAKLEACTVSSEDRPEIVRYDQI
jgi:hypothetical protein